LVDLYRWKLNKTDKIFYFKIASNQYEIDRRLNDGRFQDSLRYEFFEFDKHDHGVFQIVGKYKTDKYTIVLKPDSGRNVLKI